MINVVIVFFGLYVAPGQISTGTVCPVILFKFKFKYGGREGSRAHSLAPVAAPLSGTAARDADATGVSPLRALQAVIQFLIT